MTDSDRFQVLNIDIARSAYVAITFADRLVASFPVSSLRLACPCADCNTKRQRGRSVATLEESKIDEVVISKAVMQGAWGLNIDWSDGHDTGIYAFEKLREWADAGLVNVTVTES